MAADQRKKPVTTVRIAATSHDKGRLRKKKNLGLFPWVRRSNIISLQWDDKNSSVVAKREQIGLSQRHLISFGSYVSNCPNVLADVLTLPQEVFGLDIVKQVLSYEVWQTLLSENERQYLMQFLPEGVDTHKIVQELLVGHNNFHFGNPFVKWSASLCCGNLHPDFILNQEHSFWASKKTYYSDLVKYHNGMINNLLMWKERWATLKNPEDTVRKMWRSRKQAGSMSPDMNEYKLYKVKEDVVGISESGSSDAEENAGSSDDQNLVSRHRELQQRKLILEDGYNDLAAGLKMIERPKKGERLHKQNIQSCDGSKYMSYIKVSRKQHQHVKSSMKHSSNSIQSRSLNRVLGNLHSFHIQPLEIFEEEERKKLHTHWLQLATKDVPAAFANFRRWQLAKSQLHLFWKQEIEEKLVSLNKLDQHEEKKRPCITSPTLVDNRASSNEAADEMEIEEIKQSDFLLEEHQDNGACNEKSIVLSGVVKKGKSDSIIKEMMGDEAGRFESASERDSEFALASMQNQHVQEITELSGSHKLCLIEAAASDFVIRERDDRQSHAPENLERVVGANAVGQEVPLSSSSNVWPPVSIGTSYCHSTSNCNSGSAQYLSPGYPGEQRSGLINLEFDNDDEVARSNLWHKQSHNGSFLSSYAAGGDVQGQNELLHHHFFKDPDTLPCNRHEQKHTQFDFEQLQSSSSVSVGRSQYFGKLGEKINMQMPLVDLVREKSLNDVEADVGSNIIQERMFSAEGFRYGIPMPRPMSSDKSIQRDWAANAPAQTLSSLQSLFGYGELVQNGITGDDQTFDGWSNSESSSHVTGVSNRINVDGSLYVGGLSQCNNSNNTELPYLAPFDLVQVPGQQFSESGFGSSSFYGGSGISVVPSVINNNVFLHPQGHLLTGPESSSSVSLPPPLVKNSNPLLVQATGSFDIPPQNNSVLQDSMIKPFLRPWNG